MKSVVGPIWDVQYGWMSVRYRLHIKQYIGLMSSCLACLYMYWLFISARYRKVTGHFADTPLNILQSLMNLFFDTYKYVKHVYIYASTHTFD